MKISHHIILNNEHPKIIDWNLMRDDPNLDSFYIPFSKEEYLNSIEPHVENTNYKEIIDYCNLHNISKVISIGSGRCILEYALKKNSELEVIVSDTTNSINRIKEFNIFDQAILANFLNEDKILADNNTLILLCRIDTEFNDKDFTVFFEKLNQSNVKHICYIPTGFLDLKIALLELKIQLVSFFLGKKKIFSGYSRTLSSHKKCWEKYYSISELNHTKKLIFLKNN